jgi:hypothetical protein
MHIISSRECERRNRRSGAPSPWISPFFCETTSRSLRYTESRNSFRGLCRLCPLHSRRKSIRSRTIMNTIVSYNGRTQQGVLSTLLPREAGIVSHLSRKGDARALTSFSRCTVEGTTLTKAILIGSRGLVSSMVCTGVSYDRCAAATDSTRLLTCRFGISLERIVFSRIAGRSLYWSHALPVKVCCAKLVIGWTRPQFGLMCSDSIARDSKRNSGADHCVGRGWL